MCESNSDIYICTKSTIPLLKSSNTSACLHYKVVCWLVLCVFWCKSLKEIVSFLSHMCSSNQFVLRIVHLLRHNQNCSLDTSTTVTKLIWHIYVILVRPVVLLIAGIVVGYWRNGCSYRNICREVGLHSNTVYGTIKRFRERGNFVCGRRTRQPRKINDRDDRVLPWLAMENRGFSVQKLRCARQLNLNFAVSRQTVNRRLVARAYRARRMVKVSRLTVRAKLVRRHWAQKHINRPLGQWQHVIFCDESIHALPDRQSDPCSTTGFRSHEWRLHTW